MSGPWIIPLLMITALGSLVDMVQFVWIIKRGVRKLKRSMYNKIKRQILEKEGYPSQREEG